MRKLPILADGKRPQSNRESAHIVKKIAVGRVDLPTFMNCNGADKEINIVYGYSNRQTAIRSGSSILIVPFPEFGIWNGAQIVAQRFELALFAYAGEEFLPYCANQPCLAITKQLLQVSYDRGLRRIEMLRAPAQCKRPHGCVDQDSHGQRFRRAAL